MKSSTSLYWIVLAVLLAGAYGSFVLVRKFAPQSPAEPLASVPSSTPRMTWPPMEDFVLTDESGQPFDSASLRGKVWVGSFFFTNCPGSCWKLNQALAALQADNADSQVRYISITCDPENDSPEALKKYAEAFHADPARWTFLTGPMRQILKVGNEQFKVSVGPGTHTDYAFIVDRAGTVRGKFVLTDPMQLALLKRTLAAVEAESESAPPANSAADQASPDAEPPAPVDPAGEPSG